MGKFLSVFTFIAGFALVCVMIIHVHFTINAQNAYLVGLYSCALAVGAFIWAASLICLAFGFRQSK